MTRPVPTPEVVEVWRARLDAALEGLDVGDPEDRAIFRARVQDACAACRVELLRAVSDALDLGPLPRKAGPAGRWAVVRHIADRWMVNPIARASMRSELS